MAALATVAQLEARLGVPAGSLAEEDLARASAALDDASAIGAAAGRSSRDEDTAPDIVRVVTLRVALRIYNTPQENRWEQIGDFTQGKAAPTNGLTAEEKALVEEAAGISRGVYDVRTPSAYGGC